MRINFFDHQLEAFIRQIEKQTIARVLRTIDLLERFGNELGMPHSKKVDQRLYELRIRGKQEVRIFYTFHNNSIVLLHGYIKKSQRIPLRELRVTHNKLATLDDV